MPSQNISYMTFRGSKSGDIVESKTSHDELKLDEVLISVTASGLCGTDLHYKTQDMVLGHEGIGIVKKLGPQVRHLKVGDRVGWGYQHDSCGECQQCLKGIETYCASRKMYGDADLDEGSFSYGSVWREAFLFPVPEKLSDEVAAPLMCGGATVFNALQLYETHATDRVGVIGFGGLGHLAVQFSAKMGCDTIVFSGTDSKKEEAVKLGANDFFATKGKDKLEIGRQVDVLLVTTAAQPDWNLYTPILSPGAKVFPLSVDSGNFSFPYMNLLLQGITIQGTVVAPRHIHQRMLTFAAQHGIHPVVETFPMTKKGIEEAYAKLDHGEMRYRGVLLTPKESLL